MLTSNMHKPWVILCMLRIGNLKGLANQPDRIDRHTKVLELQNICWAAVMFSECLTRQVPVYQNVSHGSKRCLALRPVQCSELRTADMYSTLLQCEESPEMTC